MAAHIMVVVTFNRTSVSKTMLINFLILVCLKMFVQGKINPIENGNYHRNIPLPNIDASKLYEDLSLLGVNEFYQDDVKMRDEGFNPEKFISLPLDKVYQGKTVPSESPIGKYFQFANFQKFFFCLNLYYR